MEGHGDACQQVNHRLVAFDLAEKEAKGREEARVSDIGRKTRTCTHHDVQTQERDAEGRRTSSSRCGRRRCVAVGRPSQRPRNRQEWLHSHRPFLKHPPCACRALHSRGAGRDAVDLAAERESDPRLGWRSRGHGDRGEDERAKRKGAPPWPCEHGVKYRSRCKVCVCLSAREPALSVQGCGGSHVCEHGRRRSQCKECGGLKSASTVVGRSSTHKRVGGCRRSSQRVIKCRWGPCSTWLGAVWLHRCRRGGSQICEHGRERSVQECGGSQICARRHALVARVRWDNPNGSLRRYCAVVWRHGRQR